MTSIHVIWKMQVKCRYQSLFILLYSLLFFFILLYSFNQRLCPLRNVVGVLLKQLTIGHAEQESGISIVDRVVVDVNTISQDSAALTVEDRFVVAGDDLSNGYIMATLHDTLSNTGSIDGWMTCGY